MIHQTPKAITLGDRIFPASFLLEREFPPLPDEIVSRHYQPTQKTFSQSDGKNQTSAGSLPWAKGDEFLEKTEELWEDYQESLKPPEPEPQAEDEAEMSPIFNPANFVSKAMMSKLYEIAKTSPDLVVQREKGEVQVILGGYLIFSPATIASGGLLQKNLNELMAALGEVPQDAIDEFNQLLKDDLEVEWVLESKN